MNNKDLIHFKGIIKHLKLYYNINKNLYEKKDSSTNEELLEMHKEAYLTAEYFIDFLKDYIARNNN